MSKPKKGNQIKIPNNLILGLLTPAEIRMLNNRFQIVNLLEDGLSIRNIAKQVGVGTDTVVRVAKMIDKEELRKLFKREDYTKEIKTNMPWVFGKIQK